MLWFGSIHLLLTKYDSTIMPASSRARQAASLGLERN